MALCSSRRDTGDSTIIIPKAMINALLDSNLVVVLSRIYMLRPNSIPIFILESTALRCDRQCLIQSINSSGQTE